MTGEGLRIRQYAGSLADSAAAIHGHARTPKAPASPENRSHGDSGGWGAGCAESEAAGSPVTHELEPRRGRSTPGFGLPAKELDTLAVDDRATETVRRALDGPTAGCGWVARVGNLTGGPAPALRALFGASHRTGTSPCRLTWRADAVRGSGGIPRPEVFVQRKHIWLLRNPAFAGPRRSTAPIHRAALGQPPGRRLRLPLKP